MQRERNFLRARLPHKELAYNSTSMLTRNSCGREAFDAERLSRANMNNTVYATILKHTQPHRVVGSFV